MIASEEASGNFDKFNFIILTTRSHAVACCWLRKIDDATYKLTYLASVPGCDEKVPAALIHIILQKAVKLLKDKPVTIRFDMDEEFLLAHQDHIFRPILFNLGFV